MATPLKKLQTMAYQGQELMRAIMDGRIDAAIIWACSIENTAKRWGPQDVMDGATKVWRLLKEQSMEESLEASSILSSLIESYLS